MRTTYHTIQNIRNNITQKEYERAFRMLSGEVQRILRTSSIAQMIQESGLGDPRLDDALLDIANQHDALNDWNPDPDSILIIGTNFFTVGGHSLWAEEIAKSALRIGKKAHVVLTDLLDKKNDPASLSPRLEENNIKVTHLIGEGLYDKFRNGISVLRELRPSKVFLLNHHDDGVAVALAGMARKTGKVVFVHHADHSFSLGTATRNFIHCDTFPESVENCIKRLGHDSLFLPPAVRDSGRTIPQTLDGPLRTASCGNHTKFLRPYTLDYSQTISELISKLGIRHHHIGPLPEAVLNAIRNQIVNKGGDPNNFIYVSNTPSLTSYLVEQRINVYIGSFPIGGGRAMIEAMAAGAACVSHRSLDGRVVSDINATSPDMPSWETEAQLEAILSAPSEIWLKEQAAIARSHFLKYYDTHLLEDFLHQLDKGIPRLAVPPVRLSVDAHDLHHDRNPYWVWLKSHWIALNEKERRITALKQSSTGLPLLNFVIFVNDDASDQGLKNSIETILAQDLSCRAWIVSTGPQAAVEGTRHFAWNTDTWAELASAAIESPNTWLTFMKAGDLLDHEASIHLMESVLSNAQAGLIYTDEDSVDEEFLPDQPRLKGNFDIDLLRTTDYTGRFLLMRGREYAEIGGLSEVWKSSMYLDYVFRFVEKYGPGAIHHVPEVVFHATKTKTQPSADTIEQQARVVAEHLSRLNIAATISEGVIPGTLRISYHHQTAPLVSIIIPTKNQQAMLARCVETLTSQTTYTNYELLIVDNQSDEAEAQAYIGGIEDLNLPQIQVLHYNHPFNYSAVNNFAAGKAKGDYLVLLNNDTAILDGSWLEALLNHAQRPEVGIVGAKLLFPDGSIQHGGVILGLRGPADHPFIGEPMNATGYGGRLMIDQQYSAVTAACMMIRKSIFEEVGGLDEEAFKVSYNDIDLCLKVRQAGYSVIWTPYAQLMHVANVSQKAEDSAKQEAKQARFAAEQRTMYQRWMPQIKADPFYNPNFRLKGSGFELESNPVFRPMLPGLKKLLAHSGDFWGSGLYRMIAPATVLAEEGLIAGGCYSEYFMPAEVAKINPDVIVLQRQTSDEQIRGASDYRSYSNAKLIFELDDYLPNVPISNAHKKNLPPDLVRRLRKAMSICDRIVVSTDPLREAMLPFHDEIVVLPNYLPKKLWGAIPERTESDLKRKPRIGWAGGSSHTGDLRMVADVVRALADRVDWVFLGMKPEGVDEHITEFHVGVHLGEYPAKLAALDLDLALAPLEENQFNECKSNLRLLEYGICGYPVIATDVTPYRCGFPVTLVRNRFKDWVEAIQTKLEDRDALWQEGIALQRFVREGWMLEGENLLRWRDGWMLGD
jgi:GT2 family glycosyltransferase/glycosyltransferase involved in cell wall biosynthesis